MRFFLRWLLFFLLACTSSLHAKDFLGKEIAKPKKAERIIVTCYGGAVQELAIFAPQNIIAHPGAQRFVFFEKLFPDLARKESVGTFNNVNLETLFKLKPDVVFAGVTSLATNERIQESGIKVFTLGIGKHTLSTLLAEFEAVGSYVDQEAKAARLVAFWTQTLALVQSKLPHEGTRVKVLYANGSNQISSEGKGWWGDAFITHAGGINVAQALELKGALNAETLLEFDPDIVILSNNKNFQTSRESVQKNPLYKNLRAVQNDRVFVAPVGGFWWDRPSPEAILGIVWLAKVLYPQAMQELNLYELTAKFYKDFYGYDLKKEEYATFFATTKEQR